MMNYLGVDTLVISLIKDGIHELIALDYSNKLKKHKEQLENLFSLCFSFLQKFVKDNNKNQRRLYKKLNIFLQNLNLQLGQIPLICEIFKNNLKLIEKIDENLLNIFKNLIIKHGRRPLFLMFLREIQIVEDKAVPNIQRIILNLFIKENLDFYLLYMAEKTPPEFSFDPVECDNPDYYDEPYTYHAALLDVLAKCGYGVTGMYFNEAKCQNIIKLSNIFNILFKAEDPNSPFFTLKIPMIDFFYNIYLDCELNNLELKTSETFFDYIYLQAEVLNKIEILSHGYLNFLTIFINCLLKYRNSYIKRNDSLFYDHNDSKAIMWFIDSLINNSDKFYAKYITNAFVKASTDLCDSFGINFALLDEPEMISEDNIKIKRIASLRSLINTSKVIGCWEKIREAFNYDMAFKKKIELEQKALLISIHFINELYKRMYYL